MWLQIQAEIWMLSLSIQVSQLLRYRAKERRCLQRIRWSLGWWNSIICPDLDDVVGRHHKSCLNYTGLIPESSGGCVGLFWWFFATVETTCQYQKTLLTPFFVYWKKTHQQSSWGKLLGWSTAGWTTMSFFTPAVPNRIGIAKRGRYSLGCEKPFPFFQLLFPHQIFLTTWKFLPVVAVKIGHLNLKPEKKTPSNPIVAFNKSATNSIAVFQEAVLGSGIPNINVHFRCPSWSFGLEILKLQKKIARLGLIPPKQKKMFLWIAGFFGGGEEKSSVGQRFFKFYIYLEAKWPSFWLEFRPCFWRIEAPKTGTFTGFIYILLIPKRMV